MNLDTTPTRRRGSVLRFVVQVFSWFVMVAVGVVLLVAVVVPRLAGATPYVIETGSMRPGLPPGTMVIVKPVAPSAVRIGDAVTYQVRSGDPTVVTHRVVTVGVDGAGESHWRTRGDANRAVDKGWVQAQQLKGRVWYAIPYLGYVGALFTGDQRGLLIGLIALGLALYALLQLRGAWAERRAARAEGGQE